MKHLSSFIDYFVEESLKKASLAELYDSDINKACFKTYKTPIDITPRVFKRSNKQFSYRKPRVLLIYPSKEDSERYLEKAEQFNESVHGIKKQAVFEIKGNKKKISCCFYGEESDIKIIDSGFVNYYPNSFTEIAKDNYQPGKYFIYDLLADAPFYKACSTHRDFVISPLNIIPRIFLNIVENKTGIYQVIFSPIKMKGFHEKVKEAIDCEWKACLPADSNIPPTLQPSALQKKAEYKSPDFRQFYAVNIRLLLPVKNLLNEVKSFVSNYTYGFKGFKIFDNKYYSKSQIQEMLAKRACYHTGFILNSHELTSLLHIPYQILDDKSYRDIFSISPSGDRPIKCTEYKDIVIGKWACGNSSKEVHLPIQREIPHVHVIGISRSGKSILLAHIAIQKFMKGEAVFVLDPHGDLVDNIKSHVPKELINDVINIDFGLKDYTPQITIRNNVEITNPSKVSDDLASSMHDITSGSEKYWGPRMAYYFQCLFFIYSVLPDLNLTHIRLLVSSSKKAKILRTKVKSRIKHPIVRDFLEEIEHTPYESKIPVIARLSHLLIDEKSLKLFTLDKNKISIQEIMEKGKLCLVNLSCGIIGKQRSSILSGLIDSLISNNAFARASIPYEKRKPCTIIKDEFYLGPGDLDAQLTQYAKYNLSVIFAHQYLEQVEGRTREVMSTAGSKIYFKLRREDSERIGRELNISPLELTSLKPFHAFFKSEEEAIKLITPKLFKKSIGYSKLIDDISLSKYYIKSIKKPKCKQNKNQPLLFDVL
ncbi:MAG: ATP-binding protein [Candidatus Aureabacteria bacterium]|nr:ATP-binding protein [Candidatus Auribacterota bacterium]